MQAARGASLSDADTRAPGSTPSASRAVVLFALVAAAAYSLDLLTKQLAVTRLADGDVAVAGDWFVLHLTRNPGAAFSTGTRYTVLLSCLAIVAVAVTLWFARRLRNLWWAVALGLLLGGVAGNLTDRLLREPGPMRGHVVDMFMVPNWPVFNVADICINLAAGLILVQTFRGVALDGSRTAGSHR